MSNFEDRNRESLKREDPKDKERQGTPGQHESDDKYSREGQGTSQKPGQGSGPASSRPGESGKGTSGKEDQE